MDKEKRKHIEGEALIEAIRARANELRMDVREVADRVGVSYVYMTSLLSGGRRFGGLDDDKKRALAKFLGLPMVQVLVLCDSLRAEDFAVEQDLGDRLRLSFRKLQMDPVYCVTAPTSEEWEQMPISGKLMLALLYERVADEEIIRKIKPYEITKA